MVMGRSLKVSDRIESMRNNLPPKAERGERQAGSSRQENNAGANGFAVFRRLYNAKIAQSDTAKCRHFALDRTTSRLLFGF